MDINRTIITSILDTDLYKLTMGQVVFHKFPDAVVEYTFTNRGDTQFPEGFADELREQLERMESHCRLRFDEMVYLDGLGFFKKTYLEWLRGYKFNTDEVIIKQDGGSLSITIRGLWYRTILWEVPLMALISELYFIMTGQKLCDDWSERIVNKAKKLSCQNEDGMFPPNPHNWSDFGTRRRYSLAVQDMVVCIMKNYTGFLGTSNVMLAMKYDVPVIGTMAHEFIMGMSARYGVYNANYMSMLVWSDFYPNELDVVLPDTFTTDVFLRDFTLMWATDFGGIRQDSGDPTEWMEGKILPHYNKRIGKMPNRVIFSDGLDVDKFIELSNRYRHLTKIIGGIGTNFTNDVGVVPLNMVIKLSRAKFNGDFIDVVKLSDTNGKHTGNPEEVKKVKELLNIK